MTDGNLMSLKQLLDSKKYPFTLSQMRGFLRERNLNGIEDVIRKIGKHIYIRIDLFDQWIEDHKEGK